MFPPSVHSIETNQNFFFLYNLIPPCFPWVPHPSSSIIRPHCSTTYVLVDAVYCFRPSSVICRSVCHSSEPCKNGWTDSDAVSVEDSTKEPWEGAILKGEGWPFVKYRDTLRSAVQKRLNRLRCRLGFALRWAQGIVLDGVQVSPWEGAILRGSACPNDTLTWAVQKWLTWFRCRLGCGHGWPKKAWGAHWRLLANTIEPSVGGCDVALCRITLTTCCMFDPVGSIFAFSMSKPWSEFLSPGLLVPFLSVVWALQFTFFRNVSDVHFSFIHFHCPFQDVCCLSLLVSICENDMLTEFGWNKPLLFWQYVLVQFYYSILDTFFHAAGMWPQCWY